MNILISCFLNSLDLAEEQDFEPDVYRYSRSSRTVFLSKLYFYSDAALPVSSQSLRQLSLIAKAFKLYRMEVAQLNKTSTLNEVKITKKISKIRMIKRVSFKYERFADKVREIQHERVTNSSYWPISVCFCSDFMLEEVFDCGLFCFDDVTSHEDLNTLKSHSQCLDWYRTKVEVSCSYDTRKTYIVFTFLIISFFTLE